MGGLGISPNRAHSHRFEPGRVVGRLELLLPFTVGGSGPGAIGATGSVPGRVTGGIGTGGSDVVLGSGGMVTLAPPGGSVVGGIVAPPPGGSTGPPRGGSIIPGGIIIARP